MVTADPYGDPDLVALYDVDNPDGPDHAFFRRLADETDARTILDLGCGTGLLTRSLVRPGRRVTGIDPSPTMLAFASVQPGADAVTWVLGDAGTITPDGSADLVTCTGNAFMHLTPEEVGPALGCMAAGLRPGGVLTFDTRNPAHREWESWTPELTRSERETPFGVLREWLEVTDVDGPLVRFDAHNHLPDGEDRVFTSELWFRDAEEVTALLGEAGFVDADVRSGWRGEPVTASSRLLVVRAVRG